MNVWELEEDSKYKQTIKFKFLFPPLLKIIDLIVLLATASSKS